MKQKYHFRRRAAALLILVSIIFTSFSVRLFALQVVNGETYRSQATSTTTITVALPAARGEIVDRYGRAFATNRAAYNLWLLKALLPDRQLNETLIFLVGVMTANGESWNDRTPLSSSAPWAFSENSDTEVAAMKTTLGLAQYATAQNVYDQMIERYDLSGVPEAYRRTLAGIRYEMEYEGYGYTTPFVLATDVSLKTVATVKENSYDLAGVYVAEGTVREYPDPTLCPNIIGTIGKIYKEEWDSTYKAAGYRMSDLVGKSGIEKAYESTLRGTDGKLQVEISSTGAVVATTVVDPVPGDTVVLTIDKTLQSSCQTILQNQIATLKANAAASKEGDPEGAAVVVLDVKTGGVLAAANYPSYDLNVYQTSAGYQSYLADPLNPLFDRAFSGLYRPGSAFKCSVAAEGLVTGTIDAAYSYTCTGTYTFWSDFQPHCLEPHGTETVETALRDSCNIFFYDLGRRLGLDAFNSMATTLGLGTKTGLEVVESSGHLSTPEYHKSATGEDWQAGDVVQAAIGQLDTQVTPVQLATYAASIANQGTRYRTHLIAAVRSYNYDELVSETQTEVMAKVDADPAVIANSFALVQNGMLLASKEGTAERYLSNYQYHIASKTGTAENGKYDVYGKKEYNASIVAYGPVEEPELAIGAVAEVAGNGYQLSQTVRDVFDAYYVSKNENSAPEASGVLIP